MLYPMLNVFIQLAWHVAQLHAQKAMLRLHYNTGNANAPQCYVTRTLSALLLNVGKTHWMCKESDTWRAAVNGICSDKEPSVEHYVYSQSHVYHVKHYLSGDFICPYIEKPVRTADNLTTFMCWLSWNLVASNSWKPQSLSRPVMGLFYIEKALERWNSVVSIATRN
jgi:hypothetical protein